MDEPWRFILPEQRRVEIRDPSQLAPARIPNIQRPPTVSDLQSEQPPRNLSLSDALNTSLSNLDVVRVLAGITATSSGRTVYDVAITNSRIDQERGRFDPNLSANNGWTQNDLATAIPDPGDPTQSIIVGNRTDGYAFDYGLTKRTLTGGAIDFGVNSDDRRFRPAIASLNPQNRSSVDLSYTQPLLQGGGSVVTKVPIVLARIDTERSYFQYKDSVQSHVRGVIEAYWNLVFARTDFWARQQQVKQLAFANERTNAALEVGSANIGDVAQTRVAYENFRANLISSQANVLQREAALRNILKLPPFEPNRLVPVSPLIEQKVEINWDEIVDLAETQRPDIIELKLILEADQQRLLLSKNQTAPRLDAVALYRWNGLEGEMPNGTRIRSQAGQFADWNLGVNFSVPLGLRRERAALRQQELIICRDRINLQQGLHQTVHTLAIDLRNLEQFFLQYERFQAVRAAAKINLDQQMAQYNEGLIQFIVVLQAIVDWGNSVSSEANSLVQYNIALAQLEQDTGTILETHGIAFFEERFGSLGPLGRFEANENYPSATRPSYDVQRYSAGDEPSEEFFDLSDPTERKDERRPMKKSDFPNQQQPILDKLPRDGSQEVAPAQIAPPEVTGKLDLSLRNSAPKILRTDLLPITPPRSNPAIQPPEDRQGPFRAATGIRSLFKRLN